MTHCTSPAFPHLADLTRPSPRLAALRGLRGDEAGAATAEYAIATMAIVDSF